MEKFLVSAWPGDGSKRKYSPEWETMIFANITGEAYVEGQQLFYTYCAEKELDPNDFLVHVGRP
jgi:hypothetical protein